MTDFKNLNLDDKILSALASKGYTHPTPIQEQSIPHILSKRDFLGIAQTGTGKTAAFALPILHLLSQNKISTKPNHLRCLVLTPTRELATQIADNVEIYGKELNLKSAVIFGGVSENPQIQNLKQGIDILIATPGRLLDLTNQGFVNYQQLEILVLDEADRMLDMGFINDIRRIISYLPKKRQTLFFSATMPATITHLANSILQDPIKVEVTPPATTVEKIEQKILFVDKTNKPALLKEILKRDDIKNVLVFVQTKHGADKLMDHLRRQNISAGIIHGDKSQGAREKALDDFRSGSVQVLIATDIAARGIDIPNISHVINYDIPQDPESYVHRIGRTARAGKEGVAYSLCDPFEKTLLQAIERIIKKKIPVDATHPYHGAPAATPLYRKLNSSKNNPQKNNFERKNENNAGNLNNEKRYNVDDKQQNFSMTKQKIIPKNNFAAKHYTPRNRTPKKSLIGSLIKSLFSLIGKKDSAKKQPQNENRSNRDERSRPAKPRNKRRFNNRNSSRRNAAPKR